MHIIQIRTIGAWKGAQERSRKPCLCYLVHSHAFYKEWADISRKCVAIVNHKRVIYSVNNYTKNETHGSKTWCLVWCHGMTSLCPGKNVAMHAFHKMNHHRGSFMLSRGKSPRLKGDPNFLYPLSMNFFLWWTYNLQITVFKFGTFLGSCAIFRGLCAFPRH